MAGEKAPALPIADILWKVLMFLWGSLSPMMLTSLTEAAKKLYRDAKKSPAPADDVFAELLLRVLGIDPSTVQ